MAVVGFDVGTYSSYIGVARAGGIETVDNEYSDRCTPSYVTLNERSRSMGASSKQQAVTNFKNTVCGFKRALARNFKDPLIQKEKDRFFRPNTIQEDKDGKVLFNLSYMNEQQTFTATELQTMLLTKLKRTAEIGLKTKVVDTVVSVPVYFTDAERRALLDSCAGAGLNCLRLVNDTTAAALGYGITKQDLPAEAEKPRVVVFADLGYSGLQVAACAFNKGKLKVLATSCDTEVGGRDFDEILAKHFAAEFRDKYKVDAEDPKNKKPFIRLKQECEKLKKLMSANTQTIPLAIECFINDKDVKGALNREDFEKMSSHLLQRIDTTLSNVLANAKLKPGDIHSVEILGGSSRIPAFKRIVSQVFSREPSTTLNADEAVARGCALQCAILSPTFRVRDFSITDCQSSPITLTWVPQNQMDEDSSIEVFPQFHAFPSSKMLTFYRKEPFTLSAVYSQPANIPFPSPEIGKFKVNQVVATPGGESSKVKVKVRITGNGVFTVAAATLYEKLDGDEDKDEPMDVDDDKKGDDSPTTATPNGTTDEAAMAADQSGEAGAAPEADAANSQSNTDQDKQEGEKKAATPKKKNKVKTVDLPIEAETPQLSREGMMLLTEREGQMLSQDRLEKERADAKNSVEEYVYEIRDKLANEFEAYLLEDVRSSFLLKLEDTENWLYEDGEDQPKQVYIDKLAELKKVGQPVQDRYREAQGWPAARDQFGQALMHIRKFLDTHAAGDERYAHLDKADVDKVQKCVDDKMAWWGPKLDAQARLKPHMDPVILVAQVLQEKQAMEKVCTPIMTKPKPKVEPPKDDKKAEEGSANNSGSGDPTQPAPDAPAADPAAATATDAKTGHMDVN